MAYQESEMEWEEFWDWIHNLEDVTFEAESSFGFCKD